MVTNRIIAPASLVASVMFVCAPLSRRCSQSRGEIGEAVSMSWAGNDITSLNRGGRCTRGDFKRVRDGRQQRGRPERLLQAGDRAELGGHGQEIRSRNRIQSYRIA